MSVTAYLMTLHCMSLINVPVAIISFYIVLRKSPQTVHKLYKRLMLCHIIMVALCDLCMTLLTTPIMLAPTVGFYMGGLLEYFGVPTLIQFCVLIFFIMATCTTVDLLFHFRFDTILPEQHRFKLSEKSKYILYMFSTLFCGIGPCIVLYPMFPSLQEMILVKFTLSQQYPEMKEEILFDRTVAMDLSSSTYASVVYIVTVITLAVVLLVVGFFIFYSFRTIGNLSNNLSPDTRRQARHFLRALIAQSTVHLSALVAPLIVVCVFQMRFGCYNRDLTNGLVCLFSLHGTLGLVTMIAVTRPYRSAILLLLNKALGCPRVADTRREIGSVTVQSTNASTSVSRNTTLQ